GSRARRRLGSDLLLRAPFRPGRGCGRRRRRVARSAPRTPANTTAAIFREEHARGAAVVLDVKSGDVVLSTGEGRDVDAPLLPLSIVKVHVAAMWWDRLGAADAADLALFEHA